MCKGADSWKEKSPALHLPRAAQMKLTWQGLGPTFNVVLRSLSSLWWEGHPAQLRMKPLCLPGQGDSGRSRFLRGERAKVASHCTLHGRTPSPCTTSGLRMLQRCQTHLWCECTHGQHSRKSPRLDITEYAPAWNWMLPVIPISY